MKTQFLLITGLGLLLVGCNRQQPQAAAAPKTDLERFQGTWYLVAAVEDGNVLPQDKVKQETIVFKGNTFNFPGAAADATSKSGTFKLDENKTPKEIDSTSKDNVVMLGIYRMDDNGYKVCFAPPGKPRPTDIRSEPGSGNILQSWSREPKK